MASFANRHPRQSAASWGGRPHRKRQHIQVGEDLFRHVINISRKQDIARHRIYPAGIENKIEAAFLANATRRGYHVVEHVFVQA